MMPPSHRRDRRSSSGCLSVIAADNCHRIAANLCRAHEALRSTPAVSLGITDHAWSIGELIYAALATQPQTPETTAPDRRKRFQVIEGGKQ
jgi:hypothetical protein